LYYDFFLVLSFINYDFYACLLAVRRASRAILPSSKHKGRGFRRAAALYFGDTLLQRIDIELDWKQQLAIVPPSGGKINAYNAQ
jgi:hypothetical protein